MIQKFQQFRTQLLMLTLTGLAGVGIAVAISTAVTTANATAVTIARIEASGQPDNRSGASGAVPEQIDTGSAANDGQSAPGASDQTTGPDKH